jgi:hypothetical protein
MKMITTFLAIDFGICEEEGAIVPKLIEVQVSFFV